MTTAQVYLIEHRYWATSASLGELAGVPLDRGGNIKPSMLHESVAKCKAQRLIAACGVDGRCRCKTLSQNLSDVFVGLWFLTVRAATPFSSALDRFPE